MESNEIRKICSWFRNHLKVMLCKAGISRLVILGLVILPIVFVVDWWVHLGTFVRLLLLAVYLGVLGVTAWFTLLRPLKRSWSNKEILLFVDSVMPPEEGMLLDYYELQQKESIQEIETERGGKLVDEAVSKIKPVLEKATQAEAFKFNRLHHWTRTAMIVAVAFIAGAVLFNEYFIIGCQRFFNPFARVRWPHKTTIKIQQPEKGWTIPQFESIDINGNITGIIPPQVTLAYRGESTGYWIKEKVSVRDDGSFGYNFSEVTEQLEFYIEGGDFRTFDQTIEIVNRPYLEEIVVHYDYPSYAGIPDKKVKGGQLYGLEGTKVRIEFKSSMELKKALFILEGSEPEELTKKSETLFEKKLLLQKNGRYKIELYEKHGYREAKPEEYDIRVLPDNQPSVQFLAPGTDLVSTGRATVDISFEAEDDFGLKKVAFMYTVDDGDPRILTDKITGPMNPAGKKDFSKRFRWELRKTDLPKQGLLKYYVVVEDINPTGRGKVTSAEYRISLVKPSEFHRQAIEEAKRIETEARIAWENQLKSWKLSQQWLKKGTGEENDKLWVDMDDKQSMSIRASRSMQIFLQDITDKYTLNNMSREFMSVRLGVIKDCVNKVTKEYHPEVDKKIRGTKPRTAAESIPGKLKTTRETAMKKFINEQKMALLYLERVLKKLFDWRDLQMSTVRTTILHEEQKEVLDLTMEIAPKFIGLEIEDVSDEAQEALITLGKRQQTIFDTETELEKQLVHMKFKAKKQNRHSIRLPLDTAYKTLRSNRVNDNLNQAAKKIRNNQPDQIINNQKAALHALDIVKGGFIGAGQKVTKDKKIVLAMVPNEDLGKLELPGKTAVADGEKPKDDESEDSEGALTQSTHVPTAEELLENLRGTGTDVLSKAINTAWEIQDSTYARTKYLAKNSSKKEMPRYITLKNGIISEYQKSSLAALDFAIKEAEKKKAEDTVIPHMLKMAKQEFNQSNQLITQRLLGNGTQQIQADTMETLKDLLDHISLKKIVTDVVAENRKRNGVDAFDRKYLFREQNLDAAVEGLYGLSKVRLIQKDVLRKTTRYVKQKPANDVIKAMEEKNKSNTVANYTKMVELAREARKRIDAITDKAKEALDESVGESLANLKFADKLDIASLTEESLPAFTERSERIANIILNLKTLLEEREKQVVVAVKKPEDMEQKTQDQFEKERSAEHMMEILKADTTMPDEVKNIMLRALEKGFPDKYKDLLSAYYAAILDKKKENTQ